MRSERQSRRRSGLAGILAVTALALLAFGQAKKTPKAIPADPELRIKGSAQHQEMAKSSPFQGLKWQFLGPKNVSGRCTDIAVVAPKGKNWTLYVATASGGLWKTVNEGTTWEPVFENGPSTAVGDVAIAPSNPDIVWLGTGEANIFRSSQAGIGIYKSLDAGKTWQHMGLADTYTIARIVIHPANPDIVYVAASGHEWTDNTERGVFKTTDGGRTWKKVKYVGERTGCIDLVMDPADPETLYAAFWQRKRFKWNDPRNMAGYNQSGIWKTADGGASWTEINAGLPAAQHRGRIGLDVCLRRPSVLYALVDNYEIARQPTPEELKDTYGIPSSGFIKGATVYRSDDKGMTWIQVSGQTPEMRKFMERHSGTYGWVFGQIRVDPGDENTVYIMGVPLSVSNDGGQTFRTLRGMHVDHHGLWIDPDNADYLVNVNDGGICVSYDRGRNWRTFTTNLPVCQFFNVNFDMATPFRVYGSMQDHGSFRAAVDIGRGRDRIPVQAWESAPGGEGSNHAVDPENPDTVYSAGFYGTITRSDMTKKWPERDKDLLPPVYPGEPRLRGQWLAPFIISPANHEIIYHGMQYLFRSLDRGDSWERISPDLTTNDKSEMGDIPYHTLFTISESPLKYGLIYVGTDDGRAWVTRDGGKNWQEVIPGLAPQKWVSRLVASVHDLATVYLTQNGKRDDDFTPYVWKSSDFGRTWTSIAAGIPVGPVNVIREDPINPAILYVGTDLGVYVTNDGGKSWNVLGGNLPSTYVHDLIVHPRDNILVVATHGRGMWAIDVDPVNQKSKRQFRRFD